MYIRKALSLYSNHFLSILLIGILIGFPLQVVSYTFSSFGSALFEASISSMILSVVIQLFIFNLMQIPLITLAEQVQDDGKVNYLEIIKNFVMLLVPVSIMNLYILVCVLIGLPLFILPGIFMLVLFLLFPYTQIIEKKSGFNLFKKVYYIGRSSFVDMLIISIMFICFYIIVWTLTSNGLFWFDSNMDFGLFLLLRLIINYLILPIGVFVIAMNYYDWKYDSEQLGSEKQYG